MRFPAHRSPSGHGDVRSGGELSQFSLLGKLDSGEDAGVGVGLSGQVANPGIPAQTRSDRSFIGELSLGHILGLEHELHIKVELGTYVKPDELNQQEEVFPEWGGTQVGQEVEKSLVG